MTGLRKIFNAEKRRKQPAERRQRQIDRAKASSRQVQPECGDAADPCLHAGTGTRPQQDGYGKLSRADGNRDIRADFRIFSPAMNDSRAADIGNSGSMIKRILSISPHIASKQFCKHIRDERAEIRRSQGHGGKQKGGCAMLHRMLRGGSLLI